MTDSNRKQMIEYLKEVLSSHIERIKENEAKGICYTIEHHPTLSYWERREVYGYISKRKPSANTYNQFYNHPEFTQHSAWWWFRGDKGQKQRILFLKHLIKELEDGTEETSI